MHAGRIRRFVILSSVFALAPLAGAQIGTQQAEVIEISVDTGVHANPFSVSDVVAEQIVDFGDVAWFRLIFDDVSLSPGSYLRITSLADGAVQHLDAQSIADSGNTSAYFNGSLAKIELIAGPNTQGNVVRGGSAQVSAPPLPAPESICDGVDERVVDDADGFARMVALNLSGPCSATIVTEEGCMFSAGHCVNILGIAQFNVPLSSQFGFMQHPPPSDQYFVNQSSIVDSSPDVIGNDYASFSCFPNSETNLTVVEAEGIFYPIAAQIPPDGTTLRVTGFGFVLGGGPTDNAQQTDTGLLVGANESQNRVDHTVDTTGGSSGSGIIIEATGEFLGIHTHGGCNVSPFFNSGTLFTHPDLQPGVICCDTGPPILQQPQSTTACAGGSTSFSIEIDSENPTYQWFFNGFAIPNATGPTFAINIVTASAAGNYTCLVGDPCPTLSETATLTVDPPPTILVQPQSLDGCIGSPAELSITLDGEGPFTYQWRLNNVDIPGANSPTLTIDPISKESFGVYRCVVGDDCGVGNSNAAILSPADPFEIVGQPLDTQASMGGSIFLAVGILGDDVSYQWRREGTPIPGETASFLFLSDAQCGDAGQYDVIVSNVCMEETSLAATVIVAGCVGLGAGDGDGDNDIDIYDFRSFFDCVTGPEGQADSECAVFDFDNDNDVDLTDYAEFEIAFTG